MDNMDEDISREPLITLNEARQLLEYLEDGYQEEANNIILNVVNRHQNSLYSEVGRMTRTLHKSITDFCVDNRLQSIAENEMPDATERLRYVITMTDKAANRTMDAVDNCMPLAQKLDQSINEIRPLWDALMHNNIEKSKFVELVHKLDNVIDESKKDSRTLCDQLTEILMAQDFQDLTGQMINKIINLVGEVEGKLLQLLKEFGDKNLITEKQKEQEEAEKAAKMLAPEGPIINKEEREDVAKSQDDVDDLLASLGF